MRPDVRYRLAGPGHSHGRCGPPPTAVNLAAGAVFGLARGLPIVVLGATLGAIAAFYLGPVLGRDVVQHFTGARLQTLDRYLTLRGFWALLAARLVPIVPFNALNYLSGLTAVRASSYLLATILGILPGTTPTSPSAPTATSQVRYRSLRRWARYCF